ncbi:MAG: ClpXP protease specificity-enhancing factor [Burkholderiales bacterium]|nr:ClpXP protease specificity-enhancing factor [Burkholderiales bacterium]
MTTPNDSDSQGTSTRPYLIRALHDWCTDNGFTPYLAVYVDGSVRVPQEYVKNNEIVLNVSFEATSQLELGNEFVEFKARFGGISREISVPMDHVIAIYARENGQGMAFPVPYTQGADEGGEGASDQDDAQDGAERPTPLRLARTPRAPASKDAKEKQHAPVKATSKLVEDKVETKAPSPMSIVSSDGDEPPPDASPPVGGGGRPALRRVK